MSTVIRRNGLLVLPVGSKFCLAGTAPEQPWPKLATNTLAYSNVAQGVIDLGGGLVRSPQGIYATLAEDALDEAGGTYAKGTVLFMDPSSPVQLAAKVGGGGKTGEPLQIVFDGKPYRRSAVAMAAGIAMAGSAFVLGWVMLG